MRFWILLLAPLLAACGGGGEETPGGGSRAGVQTADGGGSPPAVQTAGITGLYEGPGEGERRSRMCVVSEGSGAASFGLVVETPAGSCSGAGNAMRTGDLLRLTMTGDEQCTIEAALDGTSVKFPGSVPDACAYYCATSATLAGVAFEKTGGTAQDARRATDLVGEPLCG